MVSTGPAFNVLVVVLAIASRRSTSPISLHGLRSRVESLVPEGAPATGTETEETRAMTSIEGKRGGEEEGEEGKSERRGAGEETEVEAGRSQEEGGRERREEGKDAAADGTTAVEETDVRTEMTAVEVVEKQVNNGREVTDEE